MHAFAESIKAELKYREWSVADLSRESGVTIAYIYRILNGQQNPTLQVADKLASALGLVITTGRSK